MTRHNPQGPILPLVSEIDRLFHQKRREHRANTTMHQRDEPVDGQHHQPVDGNAGALARPRAIRDHLTPILDDLNPGIVAPKIQEAHFELKPVMFNMLNSIGQFGGSPHEDARQHIHRARAWLSGVPAGSLESWADLLTMITNSPLLDIIANNDYQFPTSRLGSGRRTSGKLELDANDSVSAQLSTITNLLKNLQKPNDVREAKALCCVHCEGNHHATDCPVMHEQVSYLGNFNRNSNNPYSNTYNPGCTLCMTRHNPQGPIFPLVSEIDRLFHQRRREHRANTTMHQGDEPVGGNAGALARPRAIRQFGGSPHEDSRQHIRVFLEVRDSFRQQGVHEDVLKLKLFPYSFRNRARAWLSGTWVWKKNFRKLELDANDSVSAQLSAITNLLKNLQKPSDVREAKALSCVHCEGNHNATDYPVMHEQVSYLGNFNRNSNNPFSNTYNPG
ncbi:hypothetical protein GQ457_17G010400 [Hibiscus cannabinus]